MFILLTLLERLIAWSYGSIPTDEEYEHDWKIQDANMRRLFKNKVSTHNDEYWS